MSRKSSLEAVFGPESSGDTPSERARTSTRRFVRSQHQLSIYREGAKGRILDATEALRLFGWDTLEHLADHVATPIVAAADEPYSTIQQGLTDLNVPLKDAAKRAGWPADLVGKFVNRQQIPFRKLDRLAQVLGLDGDTLSFRPGAGGDGNLRARMRTLKGRDPQRFTNNTVLALAEAAWTIQKQFELGEMVGAPQTQAIRTLGFKPIDDYGFPTYEIGYQLARRARSMLGLSAEDPITTLKDLVETRLGIPVIQLELHQDLAGATVANGPYRGIVVNLLGDNSSPWRRRMTMAHELGHLLWDPDHRLQRIVVDRYDELEPSLSFKVPHREAVETRANAFAIEFLAPRNGIVALFQRFPTASEGLAAVITEYGISKTAASNHLGNAGIDVADVQVGQIDQSDWEGRESLAIPLFRPASVPVSRRGRFSEYVARSVDAKLISRDTAASFLGCDPTDIDRALSSTRTYVMGTESHRKRDRRS